MTDFVSISAGRRLITVSMDGQEAMLTVGAAREVADLLSATGMIRIGTASASLGRDDARELARRLRDAVEDAEVPDAE
jgi:hypothetical protein